MADDPPGEAAEQLPRERRRLLLIASAVLLLGGIAVVLAAHLWGSGTKDQVPEGDPGGAILAELSMVQRAVPASAHITGVVRVEPDFNGPCRTMTPNVSAGIVFSSLISMNDVRSDVAAYLVADGWVHYTESGPSRWYDYSGGRQVLADHFIYRWQKTLPQGTTAEATLQVGVPVTGWNPREPLVWSLGATSSAVGGPVMHCGSGSIID